MNKIFFIILSLCTFVFSDISFVQTHDTTSNTSGNTFNIAFDSPNTEGNLLIAVIEGYSTYAEHSVSDDLENTWALIDSFWYASPTCGISAWYVKNCKSGANSVTATYSENQIFRRFAILEYSGVDTIDPLVHHSLFYGTTPVVGTDVIVSSKGLPSEVGCLLFSTWEEANGLSASGATAGTGFTLRFTTDAAYHLYGEDSICTGTDSVASTWSIAYQGEIGNYNGIYAIFKPLETET